MNKDKNINMDELLHVATFAGQIMLESGAETYRAEEIIWRLCKVYGADEAEALVTTTGIMVSLCHDGKSYSLIKRISNRTVDLSKVDRVNDLSRSILNLDLSVKELKTQLEKINKVERYSVTSTVLISAIGAFCFVFLFNGSFGDAIAAFFIGLIIKFISMKFSDLNINLFFINSICSGIVSIMAILFFKLGLAQNIDKTSIGAIMLLVPGLAITNAIRDTISGDLLAGLTRAAEAFLVAISIAVGTGAVMSLWINVFGGV